MHEYEAEVTIITKVRVKTKATNYTGAHKLFEVGQCQVIETLSEERTVDDVRQRTPERRRS
jgi:hypothetical protein